MKENYLTHEYGILKINFSKELTIRKPGISIKNAVRKITHHFENGSFQYNVFKAREKEEYRIVEGSRKEYALTFEVNPGKVGSFHKGRIKEVDVTIEIAMRKINFAMENCSRKVYVNIKSIRNSYTRKIVAYKE